MTGPDNIPRPQEMEPLPPFLTDSMSLRFKKLREGMRHELKADNLYFEQHPDRTCRVRFPFPNEEEFLRLLEIVTGDENFPSDEQDMVVIVARTKPGIYIRKPIPSIGLGFTDDILDRMSESSDNLLNMIMDSPASPQQDDRPDIE